MQSRRKTASFTAAAMASPALSQREPRDRLPAVPTHPSSLTPGTLQLVELDRRTHAFLVDADRLPHDPNEGSVVSLGDPRHGRAQGSNDLAFGHYEYCGLDEGFFVALCDLTYRVPVHLAIRAENMLRVRIATEGGGEYRHGADKPLDMTSPSVAIVVEPSGQAPAESIMTGRQRAIEIFVHRDVLARFYPGDSLDLPSVVRSFLAGDLAQTTSGRLPITGPLLRALEDLQSCTLQGQSRRLVIRARAVEILCYTMEAFARDESEAGPKASRVARNGVIKAQRLLDRAFADPPSLEALAHAVGMSRSGLCTAFRQATGQSVYDYIAELRMQAAVKMLTLSDVSIAEVAYAVGYGHPSSFSTAIQRRYGITASELRRVELITGASV